MTLMLTKNRFGRIVLHLMCLVHDGKWRWHWAGICREFIPGQHVPKLSSEAEIATLETN